MAGIPYDARLHVALPGVPTRWKSRDQHAARVLSWMQRRMLSLVIHVRRKDHRDPLPARFCTGFLLDYGDKLHWITAGHVLGRVVDPALNSQEYEVLRVRWYDLHPDESEQSIPAVLPDIHAGYDPQDRSDAGIVTLPENTAALLRKNPAIRPFRNREVLRGRARRKLEGVFVVGFPASWTRDEQRRLGAYTMCDLSASPVALPARLVDPTPHLHEGEFWRRPALYLEVVRKGRAGDRPLDALQGMSGRAVVALFRDSRGRMVDRVLGIQCAQLGTGPMVWAEPVQHVVDFLEWKTREIARLASIPPTGQAGHARAISRRVQ